MTPIVVLVAWIGINWWFYTKTCVLENHEYERRRDLYVCKKCGLQKRAIKND